MYGSSDERAWCVYVGWMRSMGVCVDVHVGVCWEGGLEGHVSCCDKVY